jgi:hypothetical protein
MGYDLEPLRTLESKRALFREALAGTGCSFSSTTARGHGRAVPDGKGVGWVRWSRAPRPSTKGKRRNR